ncbi:FAD-dependent monooxygenase [Catenulispora sp. NF23]|uniref:FAD-dependent monooxygenase n=1 Tax=Catenulispora pinistramenti TaxID=2705254 RepID=A0ABS5KSG0_9ACTN|nr:FAD-dependent monooxygenase [Catenulispora pinistramenti]MBS2532670.1 FAD-dependent monooxygenase [Catenulispora pinistramenti]MBS2548983.1 FAD-dependent monooxygenase [Catenulispora pinistramenti]
MSETATDTEALAISTEVLIVGAGPAGLLLAAELRLAGVDTIVIERHARRPDFCRGFNLNARALDLLARRGLADRFVSEGWQVPNAPVSGLPVTFHLAGTHTDHPFTLGIPQTRVEEVLEAHAVSLGADIRRGHELRALHQVDQSVSATIATDAGEYRVRAAYLAGCDGGRSTVRKLAGIDFPGTAATRHTLLGDVELTDPAALPFGATDGPGGTVFAIPRPGYVRIITADQDPPADKDTPVPLSLLQNAVDTALGRHVELRAARWLTRFGDAARQAAEYVRGRIVLAGDAAHIHPPAGAIGVNVALDDAFNLGWKLAATVRGTAPTGLLASYHTERHAAGARVLANTRAQVLLAQADSQLRPLVDLLTRVAKHPAGNRAFVETVTGLDTRYDMLPDADHPWLGRLCPNLALATDTGATDLATFLTPGRALLLDLAEGSGISESARGWEDRVDVVRATCPEHPELRAVLVRPDGHIAWLQTTVHDHTDGIRQALERWFGPALQTAGLPAG